MGWKQSMATCVWSWAKCSTSMLLSPAEKTPFIV
jgi:hypothetical protein